MFLRVLAPWHRPGRLASGWRVDRQARGQDLCLTQLPRPGWCWPAPRPAPSNTWYARQGSRVHAAPRPPARPPAVADPEAGVEPVIDRSIQAREAARKKAEAAQQEEADRKQREAAAAAEAKRKQEEADRAAAEAAEEERRAAEKKAAADKKAAEEKAAAEKKAAEEKAAAEKKKKAAATPAAEEGGAAPKKPSPPPKGGAKPAPKALPEGGGCLQACRSWEGGLAVLELGALAECQARKRSRRRRVCLMPACPARACLGPAEDMTTEMTDEDMD